MNGDVVTEFSNCLAGNFSLSKAFSVPQNGSMCKDDKSDPMLRDVTSDVLTKQRIVTNGIQNSMCLPKLNRSDSNCLLPFINNLISTTPLVGDSRNDDHTQSEQSSSSSVIITSESSSDSSSSGSESGEEESSSSSVEEIFCPRSNTVNDIRRDYYARHTVTSEQPSSVCMGRLAINSPYQAATAPIVPKLEAPKVENCQKKDLVMPELVPTIVIDDDDSLPSPEESHPQVVVSVTDSPEMPKLVPFSSDAEELLKIKAECSSRSLQFQMSAKRLLFRKDRNDCLKVVSSTETLAVERRVVEKMANEVAEMASADSKKGCSSGLSSVEEISQHSHEGRDNPKSKSPSSTPTRKTRKSTRLANEKSFNSDCDSRDSCENVRQPHVVLRRISLEQCMSTMQSGEPNFDIVPNLSFKDYLSSPENNKRSVADSPDRKGNNRNSSSDSPEIEEIEGIRFFQFRSKQAMEEFNQKPVELKALVTAKTADMIQMKGWRNKYYLPESEFQYPGSEDDNSINESSQNAVSLPPIDTSNDNKCLDFRNHICSEIKTASDEKNTSETVKEEEDSPVSENTGQTTECKEEPKPSCSQTNESEMKSRVLDKSPMSAFVSKELDDFLSNSSQLNVPVLQKVNPNITPIPPDASILSIEKIRKIECGNILVRRSGFFYRMRIPREDTGNVEEVVPMRRTVSAIRTPHATVVTLDSTSSSSSSSADESSSSDENVPVAKLKQETSISDKPRKFIRRRKRSENGLGQVSEMPRLRMARSIQAPSEECKVPEAVVAAEKKEDVIESSSSSSSEDEEIPEDYRLLADGTQPVIKKTIFMQDAESKLVDEFLNNLNMYGTSKDVAMLVQSNQSYYAEGPVLSGELCSEAVQAVTLNDQFSAKKTKPKKKLKTWQKYLPKKLSHEQQQKLSGGSASKSAVSEVADSVQPSKDKSKHANTDSSKVPELQEYSVKSESASSSAQHSKAQLARAPRTQAGATKIEQKHSAEPIRKIGPSGKILKYKRGPAGKKVLPLTKMGNLKKTEVMKRIEIKNIVKRKRKTHLESLKANVLPTELGKRSIRLPARYHDSAVTFGENGDWVLPVFDESKRGETRQPAEKSSRKQLLDVLDKLTQNDKLPEETQKGLSPKPKPPSAQKNKESVKLLSESNVLQRKEKESVKLPSKSNVMHRKEKESVKVLSERNRLQGKESIQVPSKRPAKASADSKKPKIALKVIRMPPKETRKEVRNVDLSSSDSDSTLDDCFYSLPYCSCTPCSRTVSFQKSKQIFLCFSAHNTEKFVNEYARPCNASSADQNPLLTQILDGTKTMQNHPGTQDLLSDVNLRTNHDHESQGSMDDGRAALTTSGVHASGDQIKMGVDNVSSPHISENSSTPEDSVPSSSSNSGSATLAGPPLNPQSYIIGTPFAAGNSTLALPSAQSGDSDSNKSNELQNIAIQRLPPNQQVVLLLPVKPPRNMVPIAPKVHLPFSPTSTAYRPRMAAVDVKPKPPILTRKSLAETAASVSRVTPMLIPISNFKNVQIPSAAGVSRPALSRISENVTNSFTFGQSHVRPAVINSAPVIPSVTPNQPRPIMNMKAFKCAENMFIVRKNNCGPSDAPALSNISSQKNADALFTSEASNSKQSASGGGVSNLRPCRKQSSERRRKSPLNERIFKDDSESDVDVLTVDRAFDAKALLRGLQTEESDSDLSDGECDKIFSSGLDSILGAKSKAERTRRLLIKSMFDKLRESSPPLRSVNSCSEILRMAVLLVKQMKRKDKSYRIAKKLYFLQNAELTKTLVSALEDIEDTDLRQKLKEQVVRNMALDWQKNRRCSSDDISHEGDPLSPMNLRRQRALSKLAKANVIQSTTASTNEADRSDEVRLPLDAEENTRESLTRVLSDRSDISLSAAAAVCERATESLMCPSSADEIRTSIMKIEKVDQGIVHLKLLETSPENGKDDDFANIEILPDDKPTAEDAKETPTSPPCGVKRKLQFNDASDDDLLVIDLSEPSVGQVQTSPPGAKRPSLEKKSPGSSEAKSPPKFPGLMPLFCTDEKIEEQPSVMMQRNSTPFSKEPIPESKSDNVMRKDSSVPVPISYFSANPKAAELPSRPALLPVPPSSSKIFPNPYGNASSVLLELSQIHQQRLANVYCPPPIPQSVPPTKIFSSAVDSPEVEPSVASPKTSRPAQGALDSAKKQQVVLEEIVIDDSDDEVQEVEPAPVLPPPPHDVQSSNTEVMTHPT